MSWFSASLSYQYPLLPPSTDLPNLNKHPLSDSQRPLAGHYLAAFKLKGNSFQRVFSFRTYFSRAFAWLYKEKTYSHRITFFVPCSRRIQHGKLAQTCGMSWCNLGALIIRIGFWSPLYYTDTEEHPQIVFLIIKAPTSDTEVFCLAQTRAWQSPVPISTCGGSRTFGASGSSSLKK